MQEAFIPHTPGHTFYVGLPHVQTPMKRGDEGAAGLQPQQPPLPADCAQRAGGVHHGAGAEIPLGLTPNQLEQLWVNRVCHWLATHTWGDAAWSPA